MTNVMTMKKQAYELKSNMGLTPLAINWGEGGDILQLMAIAVIGGLLFSLLVTLLLLPNLYFIFEKRESLQSNS